MLYCNDIYIYIYIYIHTCFIQSDAVAIITKTINLMTVTTFLNPSGRCVYQLLR